ncbi:DNA damage-repair/toleration protein [Glycine max]|nr:DNA damage-repair/toleration protein [Glycine max]
MACHSFLLLATAIPAIVCSVVSGSNCYLNWYGISCDTTTGCVTDNNLRGESEDPIFEKAGCSGYMIEKLSPAIYGIDTLTTLVIAD